MSGKSDWEKACDHVMPHVCRPALPNPPRERRPAAKRSGEQQPLVNIHRERWEAYEKYGKEPAPPPSKPRVALRIGVFFDGTGNNASNTATGLLCGATSAECCQYFIYTVSTSRQHQTLFIA